MSVDDDLGTCYCFEDSANWKLRDLVYGFPLQRVVELKKAMIMMLMIMKTLLWNKTVSNLLMKPSQYQKTYCAFYMEKRMEESIEHILKVISGLQAAKGKTILSD